MKQISEICFWIVFKNHVSISSIDTIVKTPTTTSIQLKTTSTAVVFDTIMTVHTHPTTETLLQVRSLCRTVSANPILNNHLRLS